MPISKRLYPHEVSMALSLRPRKNPFDPENEDLNLGFLVREEESDEDVQTLDLTNSDLPWKSIQIDIEANLPESELVRVLPEPSNAKEDATLVVSVTCSDTRMRRAVPLQYTDGVWSGTVTIRRDEARGSVRMTPRLARTTDIPSETGASHHATMRGAILAEGRALNLRIDPPSRDLDGVLNIVWSNFVTAENHWLRQHSGDLAFLDQNGSPPTLYLNSQFAELKAALHSKVRSGPTAVMRNLANALFAQTAWLELFCVAARSIDIDPETGELELPKTGWQQQVVQALLARAFPAVSEEERLGKLRLLRGEGQEASLMAVVSSAAQNAARSSVLVKRASGAAALGSQGVEL